MSNDTTKQTVVRFANHARVHLTSHRNLAIRRLESDVAEHCVTLVLVATINNQPRFIYLSATLTPQGWEVAGDSGSHVASTDLLDGYTALLAAIDGLLK